MIPVEDTLVRLVRGTTADGFSKVLLFGPGPCEEEEERGKQAGEGELRS